MTNSDVENAFPRNGPLGDDDDTVHGARENRNIGYEGAIFVERAIYKGSRVVGSHSCVMKDTPA